MTVPAGMKAPPGTPWAGAGGILPPLGRSQVAPFTVVTIAATVLAIAAGLALLYLLSSVVEWLVVGLFLAVAMNPLVDLLARRLPRAGAVLVSFLIVIAAVIGVVALLLPPLVSQVADLVAQASDRVREPGGVSRAAQELADRYGLGAYVQALREQADSVPGRLVAAAGPLVALTRGVLGSASALGSVLVIAFFLLLDGEQFMAAGLTLVHPAQRPRLRRLLGQFAGAVHGYVNGNLLISLAAGAGAFAAITVLGLPYAVALALVVALFDLLPLVGSLLAATICVLVGVFVDPGKAGLLAVYFVVYQQIENHVLTPLVYGRSVHLHPLPAFLAVLAGGQLLGILGALLAIPAAEILRIIAAWLAGGGRDDAVVPHRAAQTRRSRRIVRSARLTTRTDPPPHDLPRGGRRQDAGRPRGDAGATERGRVARRP